MSADTGHALRLLTATARLTGLGCLQEITSQLRALTGARAALVAEVVPGAEELETVALACDGAPEAVFRYESTGTPCGRALHEGRVSAQESADALHPELTALLAVPFVAYHGVALCDDAGAPIGVCCVLHDAPLPAGATHDALFDAAAARASAELGRVRADLHGYRAARLETLATASGGLIHDINNLFTAIVGNAELARFKLNDPSRLEHHLEQIVLASENAQTYAGPVRTAMGKASPFKRQMPLGELIEEAIEQAELKSPSGERLHVQARLDAGLDAEVAADTFPKLAQLLLESAAASLPEASAPRLSVELKRVTTSRPMATGYGGAPLPAGPFARLTVEGVAWGLGRDDVRALFDPGYASNAADKGLKLAMALGIIKAHGAAVDVDATGGEGATVHAFFPLS